MLTNSHTLTQLPSRTFFQSILSFSFYHFIVIVKTWRRIPVYSIKAAKTKTMHAITHASIAVRPSAWISDFKLRNRFPKKMATKWVQFVPYYVSSAMCWCISVGKCFPLMVFCRKVGQMFCYWQNFCSYRALFSVWPLFDWIFDRTWFMSHHL